MEEKNRLNSSEALFGFAGWLTSRKDILIISAKHDAGVMANLVGIFIKENGLPEVRDEWTNYLTHPNEFKNTAEKYKEELTIGVDLAKKPEKKNEPAVNSYRSDKIYYIGDECMYGGKTWRLYSGKGPVLDSSLGYPPYEKNGWLLVDNYDNGFLA